MTTQPGEVQPEKGRQRAKLFAACLQQIVDGFRADFFVASNPEKLKVALTSGRAFSFDILGQLNLAGLNREVWIEAKGYDKASDLLDHYRSFVRRVALTRLEVERMTNDDFWFVSSSPFACDAGSDVSTPQWMREVIRTPAKEKGVPITDGEINAIEARGFEGLARSIKVLFLTAELMRATGLNHIPDSGDDIWTLTAQLYGGIVPVADYAPYAQLVAKKNNLSSPDLIYPGKALWLPFLGWPAEEAVG